MPLQFKNESTHYYRSWAMPASLTCTITNWRPTGWNGALQEKDLVVLVDKQLIITQQRQRQPNASWAASQKVLPKGRWRRSFPSTQHY